MFLNEKPIDTPLDPKLEKKLTGKKNMHFDQFTYQGGSLGGSMKKSDIDSKDPKYMEDINN
jgi:hypothetical protein